MLEQICAFIHNYFVGKTYYGTFTITGGTLRIDGIQGGQYFRIIGSRFNDGVYTYPATELIDETFEGKVYDMRPPIRFLRLVNEIEKWQEQYGAAVSGPYQSESFGGYSYSLKSGTSASGQVDLNAAGWQGVFRTQLSEWRKLS